MSTTPNHAPATYDTDPLAYSAAPDPFEGKHFTDANMSPFEAEAAQAAMERVDARRPAATDREIIDADSSRVSEEELADLQATANAMHPNDLPEAVRKEVMAAGPLRAEALAAAREKAEQALARDKEAAELKVRQEEAMKREEERAYAEAEERQQAEEAAKAAREKLAINTDKADYVASKADEIAAEVAAAKEAKLKELDAAGHLLSRALKEKTANDHAATVEKAAKKRHAQERQDRIDNHEKGLEGVQHEDKVKAEAERRQAEEAEAKRQAQRDRLHFGGQAAEKSGVKREAVNVTKNGQTPETIYRPPTIKAAEWMKMSYRERKNAAEDEALARDNHYADQVRADRRLSDNKAAEYVGTTDVEQDALKKLMALEDKYDADPKSITEEDWTEYGRQKLIIQAANRDSGLSEDRIEKIMRSRVNDMKQERADAAQAQADAAAAAAARRANPPSPRPRNPKPATGNKPSADPNATPAPSSRQPGQRGHRKLTRTQKLAQRLGIRRADGSTNKRRAAALLGLPSAVLAGGLTYLATADGEAPKAPAAASSMANPGSAEGKIQFQSPDAAAGVGNNSYEKPIGKYKSATGEGTIEGWVTDRINEQIKSFDFDISGLSAERQRTIINMLTERAVNQTPGVGSYANARKAQPSLVPNLTKNDVFNVIMNEATQNQTSQMRNKPSN